MTRKYGAFGAPLARKLCAADTLLMHKSGESIDASLPHKHGVYDALLKPGVMDTMSTRELGDTIGALLACKHGAFVSPC